MTQLLLKRSPCVGCGFSCFKANCSKDVKMPLKLNKAVTNALLRTNAANLEEVKAVPFETTDFFGFIKVLAVMFDDIANGEDMYAIIGATSKRDAYTLTIKQNGAPTTVYGSSLEDLAAKLSDLL